ncbi:MAG: hypothetical protein HYZ73_05200 [Elusimicrobia bacterium]|nr:hypothetical protein [Elusimicrobiota bacterium]
MNASLRILRLAVFLLLGCELSSAQHSKTEELASGDSRISSTRIIGLLQWVADGRNFEYRLELFPIVRLVNGAFMETQHINCRQTPPSPLTIGEVHTVFKDGQVVGEFVVRKTTSSQRSCCPVTVGLGEFRRLNPTDRMGLPVGNPLVTASPPVSSTWRIDRWWRIDVKEPPDQDFTTQVQRHAEEQIAVALKDTTIPLSSGPVRRVERRAYALARDGDLFYRARFEKRWDHLKRIFDPQRPPYIPTVKLDSWFQWTPQAPPKPVLDLISWDPGFDPYGKGNLTYTLVDTIDMDDDGNAELFYRVDGYESHSFKIFSLKNDRFTPVFEGCHYGC